MVSFVSFLVRKSGVALRACAVAFLLSLGFCGVASAQLPANLPAPAVTHFVEYAVWISVVVTTVTAIITLSLPAKLGLGALNMVGSYIMRFFRWGKRA